MLFVSEQKTAIVDGATFVGNPITVDEGDAIFALQGDPKKLNRALVAATFKLSDEDVAKLPWAAYKDMLDDALDLNGLKPKGEAGATAAA